MKILINIRWKRNSLIIEIHLAYERTYCAKPEFQIFFSTLFVPMLPYSVQVFVLYVQYLAGCRDSNPSCCDCSQVCSQWATHIHIFMTSGISQTWLHSAARAPLHQAITRPTKLMRPGWPAPSKYTCPPLGTRVTGQSPPVLLVEL